MVIMIMMSSVLLLLLLILTTTTTTVCSAGDEEEDCHDLPISKAAHGVYCNLVGILCTACPFFVFREICTWVCVAASAIYSLRTMLCDPDWTKSEIVVLFAWLVIASIFFEISLVLFTVYKMMMLLYCVCFTTTTTDHHNHHSLYERV